MIKNGERRRTPGGVFLHLLRERAAKDDRIDESKVVKTGEFFIKFVLLYLNLIDPPIFCSK